ncbi:MAG: NAD(P)/FAD-dependent oxidoreductase [Fimbriimonadaceae bacterium]
MKVAIIGAGFAGLACARVLRQNGLAPVIYEKSHVLGGRAATRRNGDYLFDTGATSISPRGLAIDKVMREEISTEGLVRIERPIYVHAMGRISAGDPMKNRIERFVYTEGINVLARRLGEGLDIRMQTRVEHINRLPAGGYEILGDTYDRVVLAVPLPQAQALLESAGDPRRVTAATYRPCLSVLLGYAAPFSGNFFAVIDPEQRHPLTWLSVESAKCVGRAPEGHSAMVAQMSPDYSRSRYDAPDEQIIHETAKDVERLLGAEFSTPVASDVKRWRYSQPEATIAYETLNPRLTDLYVCGDGTRGGRLEFAYESGLQAAASVLR